nr:MAG TPA: cysteine-rich protein [Bacteriophage sp.]
MKHEKEWYTCDRCGEEIEYNYSAVVNIEVEKQSYCLGPCGIFYTKETKRESDSFDLCPKCRKDFERFMRNETDSRE